MSQPNNPDASVFPTLADALYQALRDDPFYAALEALFPDPGKARAAMRAYYQVSLKDAANWGHVSLPPDEQTYGASIWAVPLEKEQAALRQSQKCSGLRAALGDDGLDLFERI